MKLDWIEIEKIVTGRASEEDVTRFNEWLSESSSHRVQFEKMKNYYENFENEEYHRSTTRDEKHSPLSIIKTTKRVKRNILLRKSAVAAALILLFFGVKFVYDYAPITSMETKSMVVEELTTNRILITNEIGEVIEPMQLSEKGINMKSEIVAYNTIAEDKIEYHTLHVPKGKTFILKLADGTTVNVNSDSEVKYPTKFEEGKPRNIFLKGEAYFDVTPNTKQQFIVSVDHVNVKVYGTKFNICSYHEIETVLVSGSVSVEVNGVETKILPNQKATVNRDDETLNVENVIAEDYILWSKSYFTFENRKLGEIASVLSKWYSVEIKFKNESTKGLIINCNLPKYEKIETFLDVIKKTNRIDYDRLDNTYTIR